MSFVEQAKQHAISWARANITVGDRPVKRVAATPRHTTADSVRLFDLYESAGSTGQNRLGTVRVARALDGSLELEVLD